MMFPTDVVQEHKRDVLKVSNNAKPATIFYISLTHTVHWELIPWISLMVSSPPNILFSQRHQADMFSNTWETWFQAGVPLNHGNNFTPISCWSKASQFPLLQWISLSLPLYSSCQMKPRWQTFPRGREWARASTVKIIKSSSPCLSAGHSGPARLL